jgi:hypothetical protein
MITDRPLYNFAVYQNNGNQYPSRPKISKICRHSKPMVVERYLWLTMVIKHKIACLVRFLDVML